MHIVEFAANDCLLARLRNVLKLEKYNVDGNLTSRNMILENKTKLEIVRKKQKN